MLIWIKWIPLIFIYFCCIFSCKSFFVFYPTTIICFLFLLLFCLGLVYFYCILLEIVFYFIYTVWLFNFKLSFLKFNILYNINHVVFYLRNKIVFFYLNNKLLDLFLTSKLFDFFFCSLLISLYQIAYYNIVGNLFITCGLWLSIWTI